MNHAEQVQQSKDALVEKMLAHLDGDASWERVTFLAHKYRAIFDATCPQCEGRGMYVDTSEGSIYSAPQVRKCPANCIEGRKRDE